MAVSRRDFMRGGVAAFTVSFTAPAFLSDIARAQGARSRNLVVVLAGAAPTSAELAKIETAVKALSRDGKKKDYADAYCARIDTLIPRSALR